MKHSSQDLKKLSARTLEHYNQNAEGFFTGTIDHDVNQNIDTLLSHIKGDAPFTILDVGCGPGRDLKVFAELGHVAVGLDVADRLNHRIQVFDSSGTFLSEFGESGTAPGAAGTVLDVKSRRRFI